MSNFSIGLSGLGAAQNALDIIGNNIANAATEGYHLQRVKLRPADSVQTGRLVIGCGVETASAARLIDGLLEQEILRQQSLLGQVSQEFNTLRTVESAFGEFSGDGGLNAAIDDFFNALHDLSANPAEIIWQNQAVSAADAVAGKFRNLADYLTTLENQLKLEADNTLEHINTLITQIAELNDNIERVEITGSEAGNLRDQRDHCITQLSELIGVQTTSRNYGVVDVTAGGIPVVAGASATGLELTLQADGCLALGIAGAYNYSTEVQGGRLGGLFSLKNELIADAHSDLDTLAKAIIQQINQYHVQGVGSEGSFTELTGWVMADEDLADFDPSVSDGTIYIRLTNTSTGEVTRNAVAVDASNDSLIDVATAISSIDGLTASAGSSRLTITADANYNFDFLPGVMSEPTTSNLTPDVSVSGIYTGSANQTYTCTVVGSGDVGNEDGLQIQVSLGADVVKTVNVGSGYAAGERLSIGDGIYISLGTGTLTADEAFTIEALAESDTSGVLAAVGINTFFSGSGASDMTPCQDIIAAPGRVATALGAGMTDNTNAERLADVRDLAISSLNSMTAGQFYHKLVADVGQQLSVKQLRRDNIELIVQNLANQQSEVSGVDINEQAAQLLVFEQMFQAMAKYLTTVQSSISSIMELIY